MASIAALIGLGLRLNLDRCIQAICTAPNRPINAYFVLTCFSFFGLCTNCAA